MKSPFENSAFDKAVDPMYDEIVAVSGTRNGRVRRQTLKVSVFDAATDEPVDEESMDTETESIRCVARENDWRFVRDCMIRGDLVRRPDGSEYQVTKVGHDDIFGWLFTARRIK